MRDGASNVSLGIYCGSRTPNIVSTSGNKMWVEYVTNGYSSTKFVARYHTTKGKNNNTMCLPGGIYVTIVTMLTSSSNTTTVHHPVLAHH